MQKIRSSVNRRQVLAGLGAMGFVGAGLGQALAGSIKPGKDAVLLVIDVQNCFLPGGTLPVKGGNEVIPVINALGKKFANVLMTQDWHTEQHASFASSHPGKKPFETIELDYGTQVLWPDHCVQGSDDARLAAGLNLPHAQLIIRKGYHSNVDSYSTFVAADKKTKTGLTGYLLERGLTDVYVCGLATDFCVSWSAIDARSAGLKVSVIEDACRGIDLNGSVASAWSSMEKAGVKRLKSGDIA
ncbi:MAG: bifunctional nicotinamidase/pyrazinamidase [Alphaproteobacteria bacterium]